MELERKVAIVTGAGRGINRAIAFGLSRERAWVVFAARTEEEIAANPGQLLDTSSGR